MDLENLFLLRQSTRDYSEKKVNDEDLKEICRLAAFAPSAINQQPYNLYAINGKKAKSFTKYIQKDGANSWADSVPAYIIIEARKPTVIERGERRISNEEFIQNDVGILSAYIVLAAENAGLQTCIIGLRDEDGIADFLDLPHGTNFPLIIAVGYKKDGYPVREKKRRPAAETLKIIK